MKSFILLSAICISIGTYAQTIDSREKVTAEPGFLSFAEKIKKLPPTNPASKLKASGTPPIKLSTSRLEFNSDHRLEFSEPMSVSPSSTTFKKNSRKDGNGGSVLTIQI